MVDKGTIRARALNVIARDGRHVAVQLISEFGFSRQAANGHLQTLVREGLIESEGSTRARVYRLRKLNGEVRTYERAGLREDIVWKEVFAPAVSGLPENVRDIWHYGITEMVNNAVDHSGSEKVHVGIERNAVYTNGWVADDGEGIFLKIQRALGLYDAHESILELAKGKLTTDPVNHTGEGIFFSSKVFDAYDIRSGRLHFRHDAGELVMRVECPADAPGTIVLMRLANDSTRMLQSVFQQFAVPEEYSFNKTIIPVRIAEYEGEKLVSRSQAKRLAARFERFRQVVLDFDGVAEIGQAFADELFRVFASAHPQVELTAANVTPAVAQMISRARSSADSQNVS